MVVVIELKVRRNLFRTAPVKYLKIWRKLSPPLIKKKKKKKNENKNKKNEAFNRFSSNIYIDPYI